MDPNDMCRRLGQEVDAARLARERCMHALVAAVVDVRRHHELGGLAGELMVADRVLAALMEAVNGEPGAPASGPTLTAAAALP